MRNYVCSTASDDNEFAVRCVNGPRRKAREGTVKLVHDKKRGAAPLEPPPDMPRLSMSRQKTGTEFSIQLLPELVAELALHQQTGAVR